MDRDSSRNTSERNAADLAFAEFRLRPFVARMTRSLEFLVHSYVGYALMLGRHDRREFLGHFDQHRVDLEPLLAAADIAIDAFQTLEGFSPRQRRAASRRQPAKKRYEVREKFLRGSRLFVEFLGDVRRMRALARERVKEGGPSACAGRRFLAWANLILRDPAVAAMVFDQGARRVVAELSKGDCRESCLHSSFQTGARLN
jgi:hypothetical protein